MAIREKHEGAPAFQTAVNNEPNADVGNVADIHTDTVEMHGDGDENCEEDPNPGSQDAHNKRSRCRWFDSLASVPEQGLAYYVCYMHSVPWTPVTRLQLGVCA